jgi:DNA repair exonuclease SbcCD ATPase subunit
VVVFVLSGSLFSRYYNYIEGIHDFTDGDYSAAISSFDARQPFFELDEWKKYFNLGATYYGANLQTEARENFKLASAAAEKLGNPEPLCMIDIDTAYSYEKSAQNKAEEIAGTTYTDQDKATRAEQIRFQASLYVEAYLIRERVNTFCDHLDANEFKENQKLLESDRANYERLNEDGFKIDGVKGAVNVANGDEQVDNEFDKLEKTAETAEDLRKKESKLEKLIKESDKSETDYRNAQAQLDADKTTVDKPY